MRFVRANLTWMCALAALCTEACSSKDGGGEEETGTGGDSATGGIDGSGGDTLSSSGGADTGGNPMTGGGPAAGGNSTGGLPGPAGATGGSDGGTGGATSTGGNAECSPDPDCEPAPPDTGDFYEDCVTRINQFRACLCLAPLDRNTEGEDCANQQAQYDFEQDSAHAGIRADICSPQALNNAAQNECPGYPSIESTIGLCNQQMFDEGDCDDFAACGHFLNMTDEDARSVSCGYYETPSGDVWMIENFYF